MDKLECEGRDGKSVFDAKEEGTLARENPESKRLWDSNLRRSVTYYISTSEAKGYFFEARFLEVDRETVQCIMLNAGAPEYRAKGIPEAIIAYAAKELKRTVQSSSNSAKRSGAEYRTPEATKVWERLRKSGRASYDPVEDRYTYIPPPEPNLRAEPQKVDGEQGL